MKILLSSQFSIFNFQFSINDQLSFINAAAVWKMPNEKLMVNVKCQMKNAAGGNS